MTEKYLWKIRRFNRAIFNPIIKMIAGRFFYSLVFHIGRNSGKVYSTPVLAVKKDDSLYVPLPYGLDTDWLLNVQSAGKCKIKNNGILYSVTEPVIVDSNTALLFFSQNIQNALIKAKVDLFLRLYIIK